MTFTTITAEQRSPEWKRARAGRVTGSRASDVLAMLKNGGEAAARRDYRLQLVCERLTGEPQDSDFVNADMQRGIELEGEARGAYEAATGMLVTEVGFLAADDLLVGCSPDGLVDNGIIELKVPRSATHLRNVRERVLPSDYLPQVTHNLWVTGAAFCDFVSYDPRFPEGLRLFRVRVQATDVDIEGYAAKVRAFLDEVERDVEATLKLMEAA